MLLRESKVILNSQRGMSLVEILIALTLLAVAGTFVTLNVFESLEEGNVKSAKIQIKNLSNVLKDYRRRCHSYPTTEQGLDALVSAPAAAPECKSYPGTGFLEGKIPMDPWENEFDYQSDGKKYTIISYGSDGVEGGENFEADINSEDI